MYKKLLDRLSPNFAFQLFVQTIRQFFQENSFLHGAALAYYAIMALVPILYLATTYIGMILGNAAMIEIITEAIQKHIGVDDVRGLLTFLDRVDFEKGNFFMNLIGVIVLLLTSTALLNSLRTSINEFYKVVPSYKDKKRQLLQTIISKAVSVGLMTGVGLVVILFYFVETIFLGFSENIFGNHPTLNWLLYAGFDQFASIASNVLIFLFMFKYLTDGIVKWRVAFRGAILTSLLLHLGQILIKYYITNYFFGSGSGVAGSILVILVWMYYTSQIIFLGAKFTKVYGDLIGMPIVNREY